VQRLELRPGQLHRIDMDHCHLKVLSGCVWLFQCDEEIVLETGEEVDLAQDPNGALISSLRHQPAVLELR
jgi:hypothetical protein